MSSIDAVYRQGVFQPLEPVSLSEDQRVRLSFEPAPDQPAPNWLQHVQELQAAIVLRRGPLPDSVEEIAADRRR